MKLFNKIYIVLLALPIIFGTLSCTDEVDYTAAKTPDNAQVYFSKELSTAIDLSSSKTSFDIDLLRVNTDGELTVLLTAVDTSGVFTIPTSATFDADSCVAAITITYDPNNLEYDDYKFISMSVIDSSLTTIYGRSTYEFEVGIPSPWTSLGTATYTDDYITTFYSSATSQTYSVEIEESDETAGRFRLVNPYGEAYPYNSEGDWDSSKDYYMIIDASDPDGVYIDAQNTGLDWGYGFLYVYSYAAYYLSNGYSLDEIKSAGKCGTYANGVITFPTNTLLWGMVDYNDLGYYTANTNGAFKIVMPGVIIADYSISVSYSGRLTDGNDEDYAIGSATLGEDVESAKVALVIGSDIETAVAGIEDGSIESTELSESGNFQFACDSTATYSFVAVVYADGEAQGSGYFTFDFVSSHDNTVTYTKDDFIGTFTMTGPSQFDGGDPAEMTVSITEGTEDTLIITGVTYAEEIIAIFDESTTSMSITPQYLAYYYNYDMTLYTTTPAGDVSASAAISLAYNATGKIAVTSDSEADGYLLKSDTLGGYADGYYDLVFAPSSSKSVTTRSKTTPSLNVYSSSDIIAIREKKATSYFKAYEGKSHTNKGLKRSKDLTKIDFK